MFSGEKNGNKLHLAALSVLYTIFFPKLQFMKT